MNKKFIDYYNEIMTTGNFAMPSNVCTKERADKEKGKKKKKKTSKAKSSLNMNKSKQTIIPT